MQTGVKQVFYFHAGATSVGGYVQEPFRFVATPNSSMLSPTGGLVSGRANSFAFEKTVSYRSSYTFATGRPQQMNGPWQQRAVCVVEGFDLLGRVTADRLIAQTFVEHPAGGGPRRVSFAGTAFEGLRIDRKPVVFSLNPALVPAERPAVDAFNQNASVRADLSWPMLWSAASRQMSALAQDKAVPSWVRGRYSWVAATQAATQPNPAGYALCSLVDKMDGIAAGPAHGYCVEVPELGRLFFGELMIHPQSVGLTMVRAELGCPVKGGLSIASVVNNGSTCPPN